MKKILFSIIFLFVVQIVHSQTYICWREEFAKYNSSSGEYDPFYKHDINSEAFFNNTTIRINDANIYLTKQSIRSIDQSSNGTVTVYNVSDRQKNQLVAIVVEDNKGILRVSITNVNTDIMLIYYIKNR